MTDSAEDFLAHYGIKGMRWGVRKASSDSSGSSSSSKKSMTPGMKQAVKNVAVGAGVAAVVVGAMYASRKINMNVRLPSPIPSTVVTGSRNSFADLLVGKITPSMTRNRTLFDSAQQFAKDNPSFGSSVNRGANAVKKIKMDKNLSDFMSDSARRIAADQKGWSESLGVGLDRIAREDKAWMADYIKNMGTRAISA